MKCSGCPATISKARPGIIFFFVGKNQPKAVKRFFCSACQASGRVAHWMSSVGKEYIHQVERSWLSRKDTSALLEIEHGNE